MSIAKALRLRLFLEGTEVPIIAASVSIHTNAAAAASIQVIPLDEAQSLKPRTMVHLFFLDPKPEGDPDTDYKTLFVGEIIGFTYNQNANSRSLVLQCLDHSSYWDCAHTTSIEYGSGSNAFFNKGALLGSNDKIFDDIVSSPSERLARWIGQTPKTEGLQGVSGLAGGIIRVMEALTGVPKQHKGINDFFTVAELRVKLLEQIASEEDDDTAKRILNNRVFEEWLTNGLQYIGNQTTFRDIFKLLLGYIYYEVVPNPTPKWDSSFKGIIKTRKSIGTLPPLDKIKLDLVNAAATFGDHDVLQSTTDAIKIQLTNFSKLLDSDCTKARSIPKISALINSTKQAIVKMNALVSKSSFDPNIELPLVVKLLSGAIDTASQFSATKVASSQSTTTFEGYQSQRLKTQIIRPDVWFVAPPKCNVIFPEQYSQLTYDRVWITETTRALLQMSNWSYGQDEILAERIMSPALGSEAKILTDFSGEQSYRNLMKHEYHTGIVLRAEWLPDSAVVNKKSDQDTKIKVRKERLNWAKRAAFHHFFKFRLSSRTAAIAGRFNPYVACGYPGVIITKPFLKDVVVNEGQDLADAVSQTIEGLDIDEAAPAQLVGMIHSVTHSIDQNGGTTSISMHHVRKHIGVDDEFLDVVTKTQGETVPKRVKYAVTLDMAMADTKIANTLIGVTPQVDLGETTRTSSVTINTTTQSFVQQSVSSSGIESTSTSGDVQSREETIIDVLDYPLVADGTIDGINRSVVIPKPVGSITKGVKGKFGTVVGIEVTDPNISQISGKNVFTSVVIYEDMNISREDIAQPFEEIVRPGWFSDIYENRRISKAAYQPLFGCDAIVQDLNQDNLNEDVENNSSNEGLTVDTDDEKDTVIQTFVDDQSKLSAFSIERAVNTLGYVYGRVKTQGLDVDEFIRQYNYRPIATKAEVLGSSNLLIQVDGTSVTIGTEDGNPATLGFHTLAVDPRVADLGNLIGLAEDPDTFYKRIDENGEASAILKQYDVRPEKRIQVMTYLQALEKHAFRG